MAGLYLHIPFCRKRCHYCDFYKTTVTGKIPRFLEALHREIGLQSDYLNGEPVKTIYMGGGTPSLLDGDDTEALIREIKRVFRVDSDVDITLEANPDDITLSGLARWAHAGINRLSIGIQSFHDPHLQAMNRRHSAQQALDAVHQAEKAGFKDISIDLIYGLPGMSLPEWERNLDIALSLPVSHISAYHLTYHEGTPFFDWLQKGTLMETPEEESVEQFRLLMKKTADGGFEQYEISNFARNKAYSKHNCGYWSGEKYLGLGPSAHSYNGVSRQWNKADLDVYLKSLAVGEVPCETEILTSLERLNDYLITRIRTTRGISTEQISREYGEEVTASLLRSAAPYLQNGLLEQQGDILRLTTAGILVSDRIMLELLRE